MFTSVLRSDAELFNGLDYTIPRLTYCECLRTSPEADFCFKRHLKINLVKAKALTFPLCPLINRAAMGRARFMFYQGFFFRRFVADKTQTSPGHTSNDATYGVYSCKEYTENLCIILFFSTKKLSLQQGGRMG